MHKFLFITTLSILWLGCSQTEQTEVPTSVREAFDIHQESAAQDALVSALLASNDETEEAWGSYLVSREIVRKGVNFEALTYLERAELIAFLGLTQCGFKDYSPVGSDKKQAIDS